MKKQMKNNTGRAQLTDLPRKEKALTNSEQKKVKGGKNTFAQGKGDIVDMLIEVPAETTQTGAS